MRDTVASFVKHLELGTYKATRHGDQIKPCPESSNGTYPRGHASTVR